MQTHCFKAGFKVVWRMAAAILMFAAPLACGGPLTSVETAVAQALVSDDDERRIGLQLHAEIDRQVKMVSDPAVTAYVERVAAPILTVASRDRSLAGPTMPAQGLCLEWILYPKTGRQA